MSSRQQLPAQVLRDHVIVVARGHATRTLLTAADILVAHGLSTIEVTWDSPQAPASVSALRERTAMTVGAGTVLSADQAQQASEAGAQFLVGPVVVEAVLEAGDALGLPVVPGAFTPTEVVRAWELGASAVKIFPAGVLGPAFIRAVSEVLPDVSLIPTGGMNADRTAEHLRAGVVAVGIGGWLPLEDEDALATRCAALQWLLANLADPTWNEEL